MQLQDCIPQKNSCIKMISTAVMEDSEEIRFKSDTPDLGDCRPHRTG